MVGGRGRWSYLGGRSRKDRGIPRSSAWNPFRKVISDHVISFIPLAPTFLVKALNRITTLVESRSVIPQPKHSVQLIALSCNGDLRSAINSLQLLCTRNMQSTNDRAKSRRRREEDESAIKEKRVRMSKKAKLDVSEELRAV
jgi:cell cycle checkpoint protein